MYPIVTDPIPDSDNLVMYYPPIMHMGDLWAWFNNLLFLKHYKIGIICTTEQEIQMINDFKLLFDYKASHISIVNEPYNCHILYDIEAHIERFHTKFHEVVLPTLEKNMNLITYSFVCNGLKNKKIPPFASDIIPKIQSYGYETIEVGIILGLIETVKLIAKSRFFIAIDNGVSHICRSINTSLLIVEYIHPLEIGFPPNFCKYTKIRALSDLDFLEKER